MVAIQSVIPEKFLKTLSKTDRLKAKFVHLQEAETELSTQRLGQELVTNLVPKAVFARSVVDLCDNAFREIFENIIVYLGPKFVGESVFRKVFSAKAGKGLKDAVAVEAKELMGSSKILPTDTKEIIEAKKKLQGYQEHKKTLMPVKAAIAVSALCIPLAEYALSYVKNLFTLKMFNQADFNNIANLNKEKIEKDEHQQKVSQSAKNHIKLAGGLFAGCLAFAALLAAKGKNSAALNHISEAILAPGSKFFKNNPDRAKFVNKYFGLDFTNKNGKLAISNGQITACLTAGFFGYTGAAKDRGKQDYKEVLYRFPLVAFYAISGCALVDKGFRAILRKKGGYEHLVGKDDKFNTPKLQDLHKLAEELATKNKTTAEAEFKKLFKQKSMLVLAPFLFSVGVMGFFVAGCSRYFTQYRYNKDKEAENLKKKTLPEIN